ncbi:MAG: NAD(P)-dependent oxidoreductase, partial [Phycisphaeraceae bacterium]
MNASAVDKPVVAVFSSQSPTGPSGGERWPGLDSLDELAVVRHASTAEELTEALREADVLLVTDFRTSVVQQAWPHARRLKWVHATSAGVDKLLFPELIESDVPVTNARGIFDRSIAEYVLGFILVYAKDVLGTVALQRERTWQHRDTERIEGKRVLVVGAGSIGRQIGRLCGAAGMAVTALARRPRTDDPDFEKVHASDDLHQLLPEADYVVIAAPLTEETR